MLELGQEELCLLRYRDRSMSTVYLTEPATSGKVLLETTVGDIDVELWSKEAPLACRNFVQLCLEGYFDDCPVHRVIKGFMMQTGDPSGTGTGGLSIWSTPFKDEVHARIKFNHRGQVAMANEQKPNSNHSQFFITLDACEWLNKKHTIFGKVTGVTMFNLLRLNDVEVGENDRPLESVKIKRCQVLMNPFDDIIPRDLHALKAASNSAGDQSKKEPTRKATRDLKLLSFGEQEDEEEVDGSVAAALAKKKATVVEKPPPPVATAATFAAPATAVVAVTTVAVASTGTRAQPPSMPTASALTAAAAANQEFQEAREAFLRTKRAVQALSEGPGQKKDVQNDGAANLNLSTSLEQLRQKYVKRKADPDSRARDTMERLKKFSADIKRAKTLAEEVPVAAAYHGQVLDDDDDDVGGVEAFANQLKFKRHIDDSFRAMGGDGRSSDDYVLIDERVLRKG